MAGIERIEIIGTSNYLKERKQIGNDAIPDLNSLYRNILPLADDDIITECTKDQAKSRYDYIEGIDVILTLKDKSRITLQEKVLTTVFSTVTFEERKANGDLGGWYYTTAQLYMCAYITNNAITRYCLIDLVRLKLASNTIDLKWHYQNNFHRAETFRYIYFKDIPNDCIIKMIL
jgi:hypothetical protein